MQFECEGPNDSDTSESRCPGTATRETKGRSHARRVEATRLDSGTGIWMEQGNDGVPPLDLSRKRESPDAMARALHGDESAAAPQVLGGGIAAVRLVKVVRHGHVLLRGPEFAAQNFRSSGVWRSSPPAE